MKTINLEYTQLPVLLPQINLFLENIESNKPFHFLRINHGIIDLIHLAYDDIKEFDSLFNENQFEKISEKIVLNSHKDVNNPFLAYHNNSKKLKEKLIIFFKVLKEYKQFNENLFISVSLGVGLNTFWGVYDKMHPYQIGRTKVWEIVNSYKKYDFYYSGCLKHFVIKDEIFLLFKKLNELDFNVVFLGPNYLKLYEQIFSIKNFNHIKIPTSGAIENIDSYVSQIKELSKNKTILFYSIGHLLSFYISHELKKYDIFIIDIGRSFDLLLKDKVDSETTMTRCWTFLDKNELVNYVNSIRV